MKKGFAINKLLLYIIVLVVLVVLITIVLKIADFKEIFAGLLESFK